MTNIKNVLGSAQISAPFSQFVATAAAQNRGSLPTLFCTEQTGVSASVATIGQPAGIIANIIARMYHAQPLTPNSLIYNAGGAAPNLTNSAFDTVLANRQWTQDVFYIGVNVTSPVDSVIPSVTWTLAGSNTYGEAVNNVITTPMVQPNSGAGGARTMTMLILPTISQSGVWKYAPLALRPQLGATATPPAVTIAKQSPTITVTGTLPASCSINYWLGIRGDAGVDELASWAMGVSR